MKKSIAKIFALATALALTFAMAGTALAAEPVVGSPITIRSPKSLAVYYIGEKIPVCLDSSSLPPDLIKEFECALYPLGKTNEVWSKNSGKSKKKSVFKTSLKTGSLPAGDYQFDGGVTLYASAKDNVPSAIYRDSYTITLKKLAAPGKVRAKAGKKKVTVSWKKAKGAKYYQVWRSTKPKNYKKVATVRGGKYTDKTAKGGQRYYYIVRAFRGKAKSSFSRPAHSGRVK